MFCLSLSHSGKAATPARSECSVRSRSGARRGPVGIWRARAISGYLCGLLSTARTVENRSWAWRRVNRAPRPTPWHMNTSVGALTLYIALPFLLEALVTA